MTVGIIGLGLIGGSIGLALREPGRRIIGYDVDPFAVKTAMDRFCIDAFGDLPEVANAEFVFVAVPPKYAWTTLSVVGSQNANTVFTDCTSVKADVLAWADQSQNPNFVIGHPMAGHERSGAAFASAWMFRGARWIVCPMPWNSNAVVKRVEDLVAAMGATPVRMNPEQHDMQIARVSHLPHALAGVLVQLDGVKGNVDVSGGSWKDLTRVAGVDPNLWTQIFMANRAEISRALSETQAMLGELKGALDAEDAEGVRAFFDAARKAKG